METEVISENAVRLVPKIAKTLKGKVVFGAQARGVRKIFKQLFGGGEEEKLLKEGMSVLSINKSRSYRWIAFHLISKGGLLE
ncbi:hypothetical protein V6N13_106330 [Hibiscus sabdariffa]